jgi:hypothetical protein
MCSTLFSKRVLASARHAVRPMRENFLAKSYQLLYFCPNIYHQLKRKADELQPITDPPDFVRYT